jgi:TolA-binding protein
MKQAKAMALFLALTGVFSAQAQQNTASSATQATAKKAASKTDPASVARRLELLERALDVQQQQITRLTDKLQSRDQQIQQLQQTLQQTMQTSQQNQAVASQAQSKADAAASQAAEQSQTLTALKSDVADLKTNTTNSALTLQETQKSIQEVSNPIAIHYKGITLTPGGFVAAETVTRTRASSADINTPFNSIPYSGNALAKVNETDFTARQSRLSLLGEANVGSTKLTGYWEADFLGAGVTSNNRQSNSYVLRQRIIYGQAAFHNGFSITGGQQWSLATEDRKGIQNRQEVLPLTIDSQYQVGFTWARQYGLRVVKDFGGKFALGASIEGPQATVGGHGFSSVTTNNIATNTSSATGNSFIDAPGSGGGLFNFADTTGYSVNKAPDFIIKAAVDPGFGHYEVYGILSAFRNRIYPCGVVGTNLSDTAPPASPTSIFCPVDQSTSPSGLGAFNQTKTGGGVGVNIRLPIVARKLEFGLQGLGGDGVGRYGSAQLPDLTFHPDGSEALIRTAHGLAGLEFHSAKLDAYAYGGAEYAARTAYVGYDTINIAKTPAIPGTSTTPAIPATVTTVIATNQFGGYGSPFANNTGCNKENPPSNSVGLPVYGTPSSGGSCAGDTRVIMEGSLGFWYRFYQGQKGSLRWGLQYSYFARNGWSGNNNGNNAVNNNMPGVPPPLSSPKAIDNMVFTSFRYYLP